MLLVHHCRIAQGGDELRRPMLRYGLLRRLAASAADRDATLLAFGIGDHEVRLVLEADPQTAYHLVRGVKAGTSRAARSWDVVVMWGDTTVREVAEDRLALEVAWCHRVGDDPDPLATPWTSHRDLLGYRHADFFDPIPLRARVDALDVHRRAGGAPLPSRATSVDDAGLNGLLRVAAAVLGVLPANRRCFRLFVHLARAAGYRTPELARALQLTGRRIRQLAQGDEPLLPLAMAHLDDPRLAVVP